MSQKQSPNSKSDKPDECPECGNEAIYYEPNCVHGTRYEDTSGWACRDCHWYEINTSSGPEPSLSETRVDLHDFGTHSTEDDGFNEETGNYLLDNACPDCGGTLEFYLRSLDASDAIKPNQPKYFPFAHQCLNAECGHRVP